MENYDWLLKEYEEMFSEKRYYDGRSSSLISLYFVFITIIVSIIAGANNIIEGVVESFYSILLATISLMGIFIVINMYFNRTNYVRVCRQINAIRSFCLMNQIPRFIDDNKMYTDPGFPLYYMPNSMHLVFMHFIMMMNSIFVALAIIVGLDYHTFGTVVAVSFFAVTLIIQVFALRQLLINRDKREISSKEW